MNCEAVRDSERLAALAALELPAEEADAVSAHVWDCPGCRQVYMAHEEALRAAPVMEILALSARAHDQRSRRWFGASALVTALAAGALLSLSPPDELGGMRGAGPSPRLTAQRQEGGHWLPVGPGDVHPGTSLRLIGSSVEAGPARVWVALGDAPPASITASLELGSEPTALVEWQVPGAGLVTVLLVTGEAAPVFEAGSWTCLGDRTCDVVLIEAS